MPMVSGQEEEEGAADRAERDGLGEEVVVEVGRVDPQDGHEQRGGSRHHQVEERCGEPHPADHLVVAGAEDRRQARRGRGGCRGL